MSIAIHKQAALAVIDAIRANPSITKAEAEAIVEVYFPGEGSKFLRWYCNTYYKFACVNNDTFASLRNRVTELVEEQFTIARKKMSRLAAERADKRASKNMFKDELDALEESTEPFVPKTEPDLETLTLWNERSSPLMDYNMANARMIWLQGQIAALEEEEV